LQDSARLYGVVREGTLLVDRQMRSLVREPITSDRAS
jgi:hypothetical protein